MEKEGINLWYRQDGCLLTFGLSCRMYEEANKNQSIISIDIVIVEYHGKGSFRTCIKLNEKCTSGRNIDIIFRLSHFQWKNNNGEILGETGMVPIRDRLKNIYDGVFLGWAHEGKTKFIIMTRGCPLPPPRQKNMQCR